MNAMNHKPWSHSALTSYETCPKRYWHLSIKKDYAEAPSEHQTWGLAVHTAIEKRIKSGTELPVGMRHFEPLVAPLASLPGDPLVEQKLAIDEQFQPVGWFGDGVWVRVVVDAAFIRGSRALLMDWKTGKRKNDDDQLALMAGVMFAVAPELNVIDSAFCWLQEKPADAIVRATFTRDDIPSIWERFLKRVNAYQEAHRRDEFPASPSGLCRRYCPVKSCPYHGAS